MMAALMGPAEKELFDDSINLQYIRANSITLEPYHFIDALQRRRFDIV